MPSGSFWKRLFILKYKWLRIYLQVSLLDPEALIKFSRTLSQSGHREEMPYWWRASIGYWKFVRDASIQDWYINGIFDFICWCNVWSHSSIFICRHLVALHPWTSSCQGTTRRTTFSIGLDVMYQRHRAKVQNSGDEVILKNRITKNS